MTTAQQLVDLLGLRTAPVALTFQATPPANVPRVATAGPSGCTYWKRAAEGQVFYTEAPDHYQCPIGAYTHGIDLPPEQAKELEGVVGTMVGLGYLRPEEVPTIPRRQERFGVALYAPLTAAPSEPDVVLVRGNAKQVMLLAEAAHAAGVSAASGLMGRPTCAAIPEVLRTQRSVASLGCIGNRVYTGLANDELYFALPGKHVGAVTEKLAALVHANRELESYHRAKMA
ncbi:MAG: DUF169 domain-containing protein [Gemmataceae bacterium]|nr:DUF169 domain-containing protein [Gemmataceae bacterium]